ncbi:MAG: hypothetical protein GY822_14945, partial [Deltaproteobacteria bacterium]|nr:hypothetical protein [Deltaproteobacteria bacterium]
TECVRNIDCESGAVCELADEADETGCCIRKFCTLDEHCEENEYCDVRRGICVSEDTCDPANPGAVCQPGQFCVYQGGIPLCVDATEITPPDVCVVGTGKIYVRDGESVELQGSGSLTSGSLVPHAVFVYSSDVGTVAGSSLTGTCAGPDACSGTITINNAAGTTCGTADIVVFPTVDAANFRAVVFDAVTNAPVAATVALRVTGTADLVEATTDANGMATFAAVAQADVEAVSAFSSTHAWVTYLAPGKNDVALFVSKNPDETKVAGVKGKFNYDNVHTQGDIELGLAGMAISSQITELNFATILGEIADYEIEIEGVTQGPEVVPLPSGLGLGLTNTEIKEDFVVFGEPGKNILWALGGKVRLAEIGPIISSVTASDEISMGSILNSVLPFFATFDHAVVSDIEIDLQDRPAAPAEDQPVPYDQWPFQALEGADALDLNTLLGLNAEYNIPDLPCAPGALAGATCDRHTSGAVLLAGVLVPGRGIVPLGLTAGLDDPEDEGNEDGKIDTGAGKGKAILDYAPPHDGLEGNMQITIGIALDIDNLTSGGASASTITHVTDSYGTAANTFPTAFLEHQGGTWNATAKTFEHVVTGNADFYRINLDDGGTGDWNIYYGTGSVPTDAAPLDINTLRPAAFTGRDADMEIQAFGLGTGYTGAVPADFGALIEFNGTDFDNLVYYMGGWASTTCALVDAVKNPAPFCDIVQ